MNAQPADLENLAAAFFQHLAYDPSCEYGAIGIDCKRPFGNRDVEADVLEIIGLEPDERDGNEPCWSDAQREYARQLYQVELVPYLRMRWQILHDQ